ncbi:DUF2625 family protein [Cryptosporangium sp. NPDC048952]|uniref:DUF2625 family protein n=1 Tax=Cryptosporangium sp. NPDC048952 TaxID=3363961 RepID=UPI003711D946
MLRVGIDVVGGSLTQFYDALRWPGWEADVAALDLDQGFSLWPPPFTVEGKTLPRSPGRRFPPPS